jgi:hypothetical protein
MKTRFKDKQLQRLYEYMLNNPPFRKDGSRWTGSTVREYFWKGYDGLPYRFIVSHSWSHAAWAAGQDYYKIINP